MIYVVSHISSVRAFAPEYVLLARLLLQTAVEVSFLC